MQNSVANFRAITGKALQQHQSKHFQLRIMYLQLGLLGQRWSSCRPRRLLCIADQAAASTTRAPVTFLGPPLLAAAALPCALSEPADAICHAHAFAYAPLLSCPCGERHKLD